MLVSTVQRKRYYLNKKHRSQALQEQEDAPQEDAPQEDVVQEDVVQEDAREVAPRESGIRSIYSIYYLANFFS